MAKWRYSYSRSWNLHVPPQLVQGPPWHTLKPLLYFYSEWALSAFGAEHGKIIGDLCPVSANSQDEF